MAKNKLTKEQKELIDRLKQAGVKKHVALSLVFTAGKGEATRREIEEATNLKQPEVSIATQEMRVNGWMDKRDIMKEGKGRPVHCYMLVKPLEEIMKEIEEEERARIKEMENNLAAIHRLVKKLK